MWFRIFTPLLFIASLTTSLYLFANTQKNQLDSIFIWKISDELKLSVKEEKDFAEIFKKLGKKKNDLNTEQQGLLAQIEAELAASKANNKIASDLLKKFRKNSEELNAIALSEFDQLKALFGERKMLQYLKVKNDVTNKLKTILLNEKKEEKKTILPVPKIIEKE